MPATEPTTLAEGLAEKPRRENAEPPRFRLVGANADVKPGTVVSRLAVILAADVVDYTRHMAADETGTHARFTAICRNVIEPGIATHGARIVKNTGDGFLAEFSSATQAVWFAVVAQHAIRASNAPLPRRRRLEFRVGINLGDVIVEPHDVFGHNVNIAARLEALAEPGGVLVSYAVFASVRDRRLSFEDVGELSLKNMDETVWGFRVKLRGMRPRSAYKASHSPWHAAVARRVI
jgi:adenylate cyclase